MQTLKDEVRETILRSARKVFVRDGFAKASVRSIAVEAGVSTANLYTYFRSKEDLFTAIADPVRRSLQQTMAGFLARETASDWSSDAFVEAFKEEVSSALGALLKEQAEEFTLLVSASQGTKLAHFRHEMESRLAQNFRDDIKQGPGRHEADPMVMQIMAANLVEGLVRIVRDSPDGGQLTERVRSLMHYHVSGVRGLMR